MGVKTFNVLDIGKAVLVEPTKIGYRDSLDIIKDESVKIQKSFVKIGWYLKHIRDNELYKEDGYDSIWECAADQLGYSQSTASRFINICEKFSKNHNTPELDEKYEGFDKSQMIEMLPMTSEQLDKVSPDMTVKQIRDIKAHKEQPCDESECMSVNEDDEDNSDDIPGQTSIEKDFPEYMPQEPIKKEKNQITMRQALDAYNMLINYCKGQDSCKNCMLAVEDDGEGFNSCIMEQGYIPKDWQMLDLN